MLYRQVCPLSRLHLATNLYSDLLDVSVINMCKRIRIRCVPDAEIFIIDISNFDNAYKLLFTYQTVPKRKKAAKCAKHPALRRP